MDNTIESACETGNWILYDTPNYGSNDTEFSYRFTEVSWCGNIATSFRNMASSLRYAGSPNGLNDNYYNLYEGTHFRGREFRGNTNASDVGDLDMAVSSLVVTGQSSWTFYTGLHYTGANVCVYAFIHFTHDGIDLDTAYYINMDDLGLPDNSIRSVARGCLSERVLGHPGAERGGRNASN
ncbi:uncharacterized protein LOC108669499 isoform X2 [Hyalella azteca]|uniref:Uncharacterized protein LOC108669499 isoform X2 n=1 Tax=Hyalella azteca TaxID=294128 RepID=A0A979FKY4_HYAAZ|nr:uncharacterized protein LOC108669499 isoform X2 [Hyalella azteca]